MTKDELIAELAKHEDVAAMDAPDTFVRYDENFNNLHAFFRPVADDLVLMSSVMNASNAQARETGVRILDFAQGVQDKIVGRVTTKLGGLDSGYPQFDQLVALGPEVKTSPPLSEARYLLPATVRCAAANVCEFMGDEGLVEIRARLRNIIFNDVERQLAPAANSRFRFDNGRKSKQKLLGVTKQSDLEERIGKLTELGGVVEMENYERVGCIFSGKAGQDTIEVTLERNTKAVSLKQSLSFLDVFLRRGVDLARQEL